MKKCTATIQVLEAQLIIVNTEKATNLEESAVVQAQLTEQLSTLRNQLDALDETHTRLTQDYAALASRQRKVDNALATPFGQLFARLIGLR